MYDVVVDSATLEWSGLDFPGVSTRMLRRDDITGSMTVITEMKAGATIPAHSHTLADETVFVLAGDFVEDGKSFGAGYFFAGAAGTKHGPHGTVHGCVLLTTFSAKLDFVLA